MVDGVSRMSELDGRGEIVVADLEDRVVGGVAYIPSDRPKAAFFDPSWPVIRMLVVQPGARGQGIGRQLTEECVRRARRDGANVIALHTTPIMKVALPMYQRMGFEFLRAAPPIHSVPYAVYVKDLSNA